MKKIFVTRDMKLHYRETPEERAFISPTINAQVYIIIFNNSLILSIANRFGENADILFSG